MSTSSRIVITGSNGFIGSRLKKSFLNDKKNVAELIKGKHSLFDIGSLEHILESAEIIYHFAGATAGSGHDPGKLVLIKNNIEATFNLLTAISKFCRKPPLLINMSSIHVYNKALDELKEDSELLPSNDYGMTKLSQEFMIRQATISGVVKSIIFRASNVYGEGDRPNHNSAISTFCHRVKHGSEINLFAGGEATFDLIYIDDIVSILRNIENIKSQDGQIYNLASGTTVTVNHVINHLKKISGKDIKTKMVDGVVHGFSINTDKLNQIFPKIEQHTLFDGLKKTYEGSE